METIIVDENIPKSVANYLNRQGFKTFSVCDDFLKSAKDSIIAKYAAENGLYILTLDSDFAKLYHNIYKGKITVLLMKANPTSADRIIEILDNSLKKIRKAEIENKLVIITSKRIRIIS